MRNTTAGPTTAGTARHGYKRSGVYSAATATKSGIVHERHMEINIGHKQWMCDGVAVRTKCKWHDWKYPNGATFL